MKKLTFLLLLTGISSAGPLALAADAPATKLAATPAPAAAPATPRPQIPPPTEADVPYGKHPKQVMDFYKADSDKPTPLVFMIHGGGWTGGAKQPVGVASYLRAGISVVSIEYRFIPEATKDGEKPPVKGPLSDAARALQFVRSKAKEWNIDKTRIGATGGSAGACSSLWLAFHPDMADAKSSDPISHESTRLLCAAVTGAQTTLDPQQMKEWTPNSKYGGHAFGFNANLTKKTTQFDEFLAGRETILPWIAEYSPYALVTADDPPIYLYYGTPPALGQEQKDPTHTSNFGVKLQEHCKEKGVECELAYPGAPDVKHASMDVFLIEKLKK
jgi:acetyl esterase/lipase